MTPTPVKYPTITAGGKTFELKFTHAAWYQLAGWGFTGIEGAPMLALAAAAAGNHDRNGKWHSLGVERPVDLADMLLEDESTDFTGPVIEALGKVLPAATIVPVREMPTQAKTEPAADEAAA